MKKVIFLFSLILFVFLTTNKSFSQETKVTLRSGTPVVLALSEEISSANKLFSSRSNINLYVVYDIVTESKVVIPAGTLVIGEIYEFQTAKGKKPGKISIRFDRVPAIDNTFFMLGGNNTLNAVGDIKKRTGNVVWGGILAGVGLFAFWPAIIPAVPLLILSGDKGLDVSIPSGKQINVNIINSSEVTIPSKTE